LRAALYALVVFLAITSRASATLVRCSFPDEKGVLPRFAREFAFEPEQDGTFTEIGRVSPDRRKPLWRLVEVRADRLVLVSTFGRYAVVLSRNTIEDEDMQVAPALLEWGEVTVYGGRCRYAGPRNWSFLIEAQ